MARHSELMGEELHSSKVNFFTGNPQDQTSDYYGQLWINEEDNSLWVGDASNSLALVGQGASNQSANSLTFSFVSSQYGYICGLNLFKLLGSNPLTDSWNELLSLIINPLEFPATISNSIDDLLSTIEFSKGWYFLAFYTGTTSAFSIDTDSLQLIKDGIDFHLGQSVSVRSPTTGAIVYSTILFRINRNSLATLDLTFNVEPV